MSQIHRFRDAVAISLTGGQTVYLTQEQALELAIAVFQCFKDIEKNEFTESEFSSKALPEYALRYSNLEGRE